MSFILVSCSYIPKTLFLHLSEFAKQLIIIKTFDSCVNVTLKKETGINLGNMKAVCESIILPPGKTDPVDNGHGGLAGILFFLYLINRVVRKMINSIHSMTHSSAAGNIVDTFSSMPSKTNSENITWKFILSSYICTF